MCRRLKPLAEGSRGVVLAALVQLEVNWLLQLPRWEGEKGEVRPQCGRLKAPHRRLHPLPLEEEAPEAALLTLGVPRHPLHTACGLLSVTDFLCIVGLYVSY